MSASTDLRSCGREPINRGADLAHSMSAIIPTAAEMPTTLVVRVGGRSGLSIRTRATVRQPIVNLPILVTKQFAGAPFVIFGPCPEFA